MNVLFALVVLFLVQLVANVSAAEPLKEVFAVNETTTLSHDGIVNATQAKASPPVDLKLRDLLQSANVTICVIVMNEELYIDEWLQYHRFLGFDQVHIHDNAENASSYIARLPMKYGSFVRVTHSPGINQQIRSYRKCHAENKHTNMWTAFIDVDEFIALRKHPNIKAFLRDVAPDGGSVALKWSIMVGNETLNYDPAPVVTRFTLTSNTPTKHNYFTKTISYLPHVLHPTIHACQMKPGRPTVDQHGQPFRPEQFDREIATLNHYETKSWEEFNVKRRRGRSMGHYKSHMHNTTDAIATSYKELNTLIDPVEDTTASDFYLQHQHNNEK